MMNQLKVLNHLEKLQTYNELDQLLCKICFHGAPTVKRVKPATLICFRNTQAGQFRKIWEQYKSEVKTLVPFKFREIKRCGEGINVLFYWEEWLEAIIKDKKNSQYLQSRGYQNINDLEAALSVLSHHFNYGCPHEIGLFLGYPLSDVEAFSSGDVKVCLLVGYWKVYSNPDQARRVFKVYDQAKQHMVHCLDKGLKPQSLLKAYA